MISDLQPLIDNLVLAQKRLEQVVARIKPARWPEPSANPGWTYKHLLAHLATGDWVCQHLLRGLQQAGNVPDWPDVDAGNAQRISARRHNLVSGLMEERANHRRETIELIKPLQPAHLERPIEMTFMGIGGVPFIRYLQGFPSHDIEHTWELQAIAEK